MNTTKLGLVAGVLLLIVLMSSLYTINEKEQAILLQFGKPVGALQDAGLHFKLPWPIQEVKRFEKRYLEWDGEANQVPTSEKTYIWVDVFARWKISDPLKFYQSMNNELLAQSRLDDIIDSATRTFISENTLIEVVRNSNRELKSSIEVFGGEEELPAVRLGRDHITDLILEKAKEAMPAFGIELTDVRIKRINYTEQVRQEVYNRMISERNRIAEESRSEGKGERARIDGERQKELKKITSEAYQIAQGIKGKADAEATRIYAESFGRDPNFYSFLKTLESYKATMKANTTLILNTDSEYLKYLKKIR
ncbi:MAG: protease modulator HflC [bacterium]